MLTSYFLTAYRGILKNKIFSAINIIGLGIGLASCLLIFQFVAFELSYDSFNSKLDRMYRITNDRFQHGKLTQHGTITYPTIGRAMAQDFPEIEEYTRIMPSGTMNIKVDDKIFKEGEAIYADEKLFSVFDFPWIMGDKATALKEPYCMVLTERSAHKYFGGNLDDVIGKVIYEGTNPRPVTIKGICRIPENSHLRFDAFRSYASLLVDNKDADESWGWSDMFYYIVLKPGTDWKALESKFPEFSERYFKGDKVSGSIEKFYLQPAKDAHLYSDYEYEIGKTANGKAVWAMLVVAFFIMAIAWINYVNLTTARALDRAKEVGLRKVMGAVKSQLVYQFLFESLMISMLSLGLAMLIVQLAQSGFNQILGGRLSLWIILSSADSSTWIILIGVVIAGILLSGFYPAFVLSSYQPATVLKGKFQRSSGGQFLRKSLVVFQFTASTALITGTIIVSNQIQFMNDADLGVDIANTLLVDGPERTRWDSTFINRVETYKNALMQIRGVTSASTADRPIGDRLGRTFQPRLDGQPAETKFTVSIHDIDYGWFDTYRVKVLAGRKFLPGDHNADFQAINKVMLNESACKLMGIDSLPLAIGREVIWGRNGTRRWTIIGVVKDFHQESLKKPIEPMIFRPLYGTYSPASIRIENRAVSEVLPEVEETFRKFFPDNAFVYQLSSDYYQAQYNDDNRFGKVMNLFTVLAVIISCLGLIGLSAYTAAQRTKEIGIRKVMGASIASIVSLLSFDFIKLVMAASIISLPISFPAMRNWLDGYAYKINLGWLLFLIPVALILLIAVVTVSAQVFKAAMTSPAETLKYE